MTIVNYLLFQLIYQFTMMDGKSACYRVFGEIVCLKYCPKITRVRGFAKSIRDFRQYILQFEVCHKYEF